MSRGVSLDAVHDSGAVKLLNDVKTRWERVNLASDRLLANEASLTSLAKGLEALNSGNAAMQELAQQASQQIGQGGGSLREIEYTNQLAVLSQRIAKNANSLASSDEIDPEVAFLLGKDSGTFRDILNGLLKGSEPLRLAPVRGEDVRATLTELAKRFTAYEGGVNAILANMPRLVVAKQAARGINTDAEPLLNETTQLAGEFEAPTRCTCCCWAQPSRSRCSHWPAWCCWARSSWTMRACAPSKAKARTSGTRRPSSGC